jgi:protein O-GlcNAc transferase
MARALLPFLKPTLMPLLGTQGTMLHSRGQHIEAVKALRAAVQLAPEDTQHHLDLGQVLHTAGRYDDEQEVYKKAIEVHPGLALAYSYLAASILSSYQRSIGYRSYGRVEEDWVYIGKAEALFNKSLEVDPACGLCHGQIGDMNKDAHRINKAIEHYTKSARLLSHMPTIFCNLVYTKMYGCDWSDYESDFARILALVRPTALDTEDT